MIKVGSDLKFKTGKLSFEPLAVKEDPLKILMVAVEVTPFSNVGGLSRVVAHLSKALVNNGHDVRIMMPKFDFIDEEKYPMKTIKKGLKVPTGDKKKPFLICNVKEFKTEDKVTVYFLENMEFYEKRTRPYGYSDDPVRWALLSRGSLEFLQKYSKWIPDIIHTHDWHTGVVADYLKKEYKDVEKFENIATLFTIHNVMYQGWYLNEGISELEIDDGRTNVASFFSDRILKQNFMRRGIMYSDAINTVSEGYAREILTPKYGNGLEKLLLEVRSKLFGVLNGIDYEEFNPSTDRFIAVNYDSATLDLRVQNKRALEKEFGLNKSDGPIIGVVGRLEWQKGIDMIVDVLPPLMREFEEVRFVSVGGGDPNFVKSFEALKKKYPKRVGIHPMHNVTLPRLIFAGADMILMPSRFEPCGIVQMESMRYGSIPVVRGIGGLSDSVVNYDPTTDVGTGFVFDEFDSFAFFGQIVRGIETFRRREVWQDLVRRAMSEDFSWQASARKYASIYQKARFFHTEGPLSSAKLAPEFDS